MKGIFIFFAILIGTGIALYTSLQNGSLAKYLDTHPHPKVVPAVEFYLGEGYYIWNELQDAATFYQRVAERYPKSTFADDAYFGYLQSLDDMNTSRRAMLDGYLDYVEKFPNGNHTEIAKKRIEYCRNTR